MLDLSGVDRIWNLKASWRKHTRSLFFLSISLLETRFVCRTPRAPVCDVECSFSFNELDFILPFWKATFAVQAMNRCRGTRSFVFKGVASSIDWRLIEQVKDCYWHKILNEIGVGFFNVDFAGGYSKSRIWTLHVHVTAKHRKDQSVQVQPHCKRCAFHWCSGSFPIWIGRQQITCNIYFFLKCKMDYCVFFNFEIKLQLKIKVRFQFWDEISMFYFRKCCRKMSSIIYKQNISAVNRTLKAMQLAPLFFSILILIYLDHLVPISARYWWRCYFQQHLWFL